MSALWRYCAVSTATVVYDLKSEVETPPAVLLLFRIVFTFLGFPMFPYDCFSVSVKNYVGITYQGILYEKTFNQNNLALRWFKVDARITDIPIVCENNETIRPTLVLYNSYQNNKHVLVFS